MLRFLAFSSFVNFFFIYIYLGSEFKNHVEICLDPVKEAVKGGARKGESGFAEGNGLERC